MSKNYSDNIKRQSSGDKRNSTHSERLSSVGELRDALQKTPLSTSMSSVTSRTASQMDGCVILGPTYHDHEYITRYRIDHGSTTRGATEAVLTEECVPFCSEENRTTKGQCVWVFIQSEAFLFSLHITALILGVIKEAMNIREISEDLELVHSLIETFVAVLMIAIRMVSGWISYNDLKNKAFEREKLSMTSIEKARGKAVRHFRNLLMVVCSVMIALAITCFILFKFLVHLGWTILSNNFAMLVVSVLSGLYTSRLARSSDAAREDQQKAILCEALLLLQEGYDAHVLGDSKDYIKRAARFLKAVKNTDFVQKPDHIVIDDRYSPKYDMLVAMEMQSM